MSEIGSTGELLRPTDPGYDDARRLWNAMLDKRPALIARCRSTAEVVAAMDLAQRDELEVAVRGGGHSVSGLSSTDGGVLIDLRPMNRVFVDPDRRRARVQGGVLLGELDRATHVFGLATTGGMVHHTGVGGLTLGGGYGWLARLRQRDLGGARDSLGRGREGCRGRERGPVLGGSGAAAATSGS